LTVSMHGWGIARPPPGHLALSLHKKLPEASRQEKSVIVCRQASSVWDTRRGTMQPWNVVVRLYERQYVPARQLLEQLGTVSRTAYFNVLVIHVEDISRLLETLRQWVEENPHILPMLARVVPVTQTFTLQTVAECEAKARAASPHWVADLGGKSFHGRPPRRGFKGRLSSQHEEGVLDEVLLEALEQDATIVRAHQHAAGALKKTAGTLHRLWAALGVAGPPKSMRAASVNAQVSR
jgi:hypothetical protein